MPRRRRAVRRYGPSSPAWPAPRLPPPTLSASARARGGADPCSSSGLLRVPPSLAPPYGRFLFTARMQGVWIQEQIELHARPRGFHLVTSEILDAVPELESMSTGIAVVFMQHTSASLTINENASSDVRR